VADALKDSEWSYDPRTGRYRGRNGRFLSRASVLRIIDTRIASLEADVMNLGNQLIDGAIDLPTWQRRFAELIKLLNIQAFVLGAGGIDRLNNADYLKVARLLKSEYKYLAQFAKDIAAGQVTQGQLLARMQLYVRKTRGAYWAGMNEAMRKQGYRFMQRFLAPDAEHCPECPTYAAKGKVRIGELPLPTEKCTCKANCRCSVEFYKD
jgi:hypothetical protein